MLDILSTASLGILGAIWINVADFTELLIRLLLNTAIIFVVAHFMYARASRRKDFYFSYLAVGTVTFLLCFLLSNVKLELGFALGLFAIFGILRYRTDTIPIKEMTYLFVIIGISVINALSNTEVSYAELALTHATILIGLWLLEAWLFKKREQTIQLRYEKVEHIHAKHHEALLADLKERTGLEITHFEIQSIDYLRDTADIKLYYKVR